MGFLESRGVKLAEKPAEGWDEILAMARAARPMPVYDLTTLLPLSLDDARAALSALRLISEYSMLESESGIRGGAPTLGTFLRAILETFFFRNFMVNMLLTYLLMLILIIVLFDRSQVDLQARVRDYFRSALFGATLLSLLASISWSIVMVKHAVVHPHINWVQTYLSFYVFLSLSVAQLCARPAGIDRER